MMRKLFDLTTRLSSRLNWLVERLCAVLVLLMILDVWLGIVSRYAIDLNITWTEELARYLMIWGALLAVSCGVYYREHVGLMLLLEALPRKLQKSTRLLLDVIGLVFFVILVFYGVKMTADGRTQYATIFGMTMLIPFAAVPVSAALAAIQMLLVALKDFAQMFIREATS